MLDMEEDNQVPIILGRYFLSTMRDLVDIRESKLTLCLGEEAITFWFHRSIRHSKISDTLVFSVDIFNALLEREMKGWKDNDSEVYMNLKDNDFHIEHDLAELERLL